MNLSRVSNPPNLEKINTIFKWNQPYLSRGSNSLNSASVQTKEMLIFYLEDEKNLQTLNILDLTFSPIIN